MNRRRSRLIIVGTALLALALLAGHWLRLQPPQLPRVTVAGGDGGGLARAQPADEHFDAAALERAANDGSAASLQALVIMRDDHIVFERYGGGFTADTVIDSGPLAQLLLALATGMAAQQGALPPQALRTFDPNALRAAIEAGTHERYEVFLSQALWSRLNAAAAWIAVPRAGAATPADCCFHARVLDWMRVASVLVQDGRFEGKQLLPAGWVQRLSLPRSADSRHGFGVELSGAAHGAEPFAADGMLFARGSGRWRLWLLPPLKLAVLFGAEVPDAASPDASWDETRLPNLVIRALSDRPPQRGDLSDLQRLVPGH
ncbi:MAG TPA: hypothetical protein VGH84_01050 [Steroidobacteraceae bacterium]|jgi:CubicO group peptidase (beta-lactamase class C family)